MLFIILPAKISKSIIILLISSYYNNLRLSPSGFFKCELTGHIKLLVLQRFQDSCQVLRISGYNNSILIDYKFSWDGANSKKFCN